MDNPWYYLAAYFIVVGFIWWNGFVRKKEY